MTSLRDHAASSGGPEVVLTSNLPGRTGRVAASTLTPADELTDEDEFPHHGQFLKMHPEDPASEDGWDTDSPEFWECPAALSQLIVEELDDDEEPIGLGVQITRAWGGGEEAWQIDGTVFDTAD